MAPRRLKRLISDSAQKRANVSGAEAAVPTCIGIYGIGLIGASIAARLRETNPALQIIAFDTPAILNRAHKVGLINSSARDESEMLSESELVILAAPSSENQKILKRLSKQTLGSEALIIDTGSTQTSIGTLARALKWENGSQFISGHPMAGRESFGLENRQSELFEEHPFFFDDSVALNGQNVARIHWLTEALGSYPLFVNSATHDRIMTDISHIPQLISTIIGSFVREHDKETLELAGTGLQSMIRLGGSQYPIWRDVFSENKENILERVDSLIEELQAARQEIASGRGMSQRFKQAQRSYQCLW